MAFWLTSLTQAISSSQPLPSFQKRASSDDARELLQYVVSNYGDRAANPSLVPFTYPQRMLLMHKQLARAYSELKPTLNKGSDPYLVYRVFVKGKSSPNANIFLLIEVTAKDPATMKPVEVRELAALIYEPKLSALVYDPGNSPPKNLLSFPSEPARLNLHQAVWDDALTNQEIPQPLFMVYTLEVFQEAVNEVTSAQDMQQGQANIADYYNRIYEKLRHSNKIVGFSK
ncbi:MAG: hypothetical protein M1829_000867 [Trizodia sp. TS-e1964]|nr:MAG: hypothetical protein M1829_000867 [Trizodia sp. TS-e1964]